MDAASQFDFCLGPFIMMEAEHCSPQRFVGQTVAFWVKTCCCRNAAEAVSVGSLLGAACIILTSGKRGVGWRRRERPFCPSVTFILALVPALVAGGGGMEVLWGTQRGKVQANTDSSSCPNLSSSFFFFFGGGLVLLMMWTFSLLAVLSCPIPDGICARPLWVASSWECRWVFVLFCPIIIQTISLPCFLPLQGAEGTQPLLCLLFSSYILLGSFSFYLLPPPPFFCFFQTL